MIARITLQTLFVCFAMSACRRDLSWQELEANEIAKGCISDSLFGGIHFGMTRDEFYKHCFEMNRKKQFFQSTEGVQVKYVITAGFQQPVVLNFYPQFQQSDSIRLVKGAFSFQGWVPFRKDFSSDELLRQVTFQLHDWYGGNDFVRKPSPAATTSVDYVKIDCNRRITLTRMLAYEDKILVSFEDLQ